VALLAVLEVKVKTVVQVLLEIQAEAVELVLRAQSLTAVTD
jgi:hypothetical protein